MNEIEKMKVMLNMKMDDTSKDDLLLILIDEAKDMILSYCNRETLPEQLKSTQIRIALSLFNQLGQEGLSSQSFGNVSTSLKEILSPDIKIILDRFSNNLRVYAPRNS